MIQETAMPSSMLALIRSTTSMPVPRDSKLQLMPTPVVIVTAVPRSMTDGNHFKTYASSVISISAAEAMAPIASTPAARRAASVEHDERFSSGHTVGVRELLVHDEVLTHRHREKDSEESRGREPGE